MPLCDHPPDGPTPWYSLAMVGGVLVLSASVKHKDGSLVMRSGGMDGNLWKVRVDSVESNAGQSGDTTDVDLDGAPEPTSTTPVRIEVWYGPEMHRITQTQVGDSPCIVFPRNGGN
ncbi:MAG: hypothetical protein ACI9K2_002783 [Myxococcota bacterium]|jgi:hypothetical protein